jgi:hypothetical protein
MSASEELNSIIQLAAWTRKEGKSRSGGLNEKGRKSYERENPGSDLKAPSKEAGNPRRASFCARMSGMKKKLTSSKTANDPDSRINKSLKAWNCSAREDLNTILFAKKGGDYKRHWSQKKPKGKPLSKKQQAEEDEQHEMSASDRLVEFGLYSKLEETYAKHPKAVTGVATGLGAGLSAASYYGLYRLLRKKKPDEKPDEQHQMSAREQLIELMSLGATKGLLRDLKAGGTSLFRGGSYAKFDPLAAGKGVIQVPRGAANPVSTLWHEAGHAAREKAGLTKPLNQAMDKAVDDSIFKGIDMKPKGLNEYGNLNRAEERGANQWAQDRMSSEGVDPDLIQKFRNTRAKSLNSYRAGSGAGSGGTELSAREELEVIRFGLGDYWKSMSKGQKIGAVGGLAVGGALTASSVKAVSDDKRKADLEGRKQSRWSAVKAAAKGSSGYGLSARDQLNTILMGVDPRPRNPLGEFSGAEEGQPNPQHMKIVYAAPQEQAPPAITGKNMGKLAAGGAAFMGGGMALQHLIEKLKKLKK